MDTDKKWGISRNTGIKSASTTVLSDELRDLNSISNDLEALSLSESTKLAYKTDWQEFSGWCEARGLISLPADPLTVRLWIADLDRNHRMPATISRKLTSISQAHELSNNENPTSYPEVKKTFQGICRKRGVSQRKAKALVLSELKTVIKSIRPTFLGQRDRALLWIGWAAALRRSEIVAINVGDLKFVDEGMILTIRKSKTDQTGIGAVIGIPWGINELFCPVRSMKSWINLARISEGPVFFKIGAPDEKFFKAIPKIKRLSSRWVNDIIKRRIRQSGMSPDGYSGHSLRSGFITSCAEANIPENQIQPITRHRSVKILRGYIQNATPFVNNPLSILI